VRGSGGSTQNKLVGGGGGGLYRSGLPRGPPQGKHSSKEAHGSMDGVSYRHADSQKSFTSLRLVFAQRSRRIGPFSHCVSRDVSIYKCAAWISRPFRNVFLQLVLPRSAVLWRCLCSFVWLSLVFPLISQALSQSLFF